MTIQFSNNAETTLNGGIDNSTLDIVVTSTALFPTVGAGDYFWGTMIAQDGTREVVKVESLAGSTYTVAARGGDDTTPAAFSSGDKFQLRFPKIILEDFRDDIELNATHLAGTTNAGSVPAPSGTNMYFYQAAAPSQWTIYTTVEDCLLAVKGGSNGYETNIGDGVEAGSWTPTVHTHTMNSHTHTLAHTHGQAAHLHSQTQHQHSTLNHTHTVSNHTHTTPTHKHKWYNFIGATGDQSADGAFGKATKNYAVDGFVTGFGGVYSSPNRDLYTDTSGNSTSGSGGAQTTSGSGTLVSEYSAVVNTGSTNAGNTNSQSTSTTSSVDPGDTNTGSAPSTDRPLAAVGILCTKD